MAIFLPKENYYCFSSWHYYRWTVYYSVYILYHGDIYTIYKSTLMHQMFRRDLLFSSKLVDSRQTAIAQTNVACRKTQSKAFHRWTAVSAYHLCHDRDKLTKIKCRSLALKAMKHLFQYHGFTNQLCCTIMRKNGFVTYLVMQMFLSVLLHA